MSKIIIYDPICMTSTGHNARSCRLFYEKGRSVHGEAKVLTAAYMTGRIPSELDGVPQEGWLTCPYDLLNLDPAKKNDFESYYKIAEDDLRRCLTENAGWLVFIVGCDYYTFAALCQLAQTEPELIRNRLMLRFIGVLENDTRRDHNKGRFFARFAQHAPRLAALGVRFSAETMLYSEFLSKLTGVEVDICPYPMQVQLDCGKGERSADVPICVGAIGAPRREKGYFKLASLAQGLQAANSSCTLVVQRLKLSSEEFLANYDMFLHSQPNVSSLASYLNDEEMAAAIDSVDYQLLAYDPSIYRYRGSAILFDAAQRFCPLLALRDNAFSREVEHFGIGYVFDTEAELIELIKTIRPRASEMNEKMVAFHDWAAKQTKSCMVM